MKRLFGLSVLGVVLLTNVGCRTTCERRPLFCRNDPPVVKQTYVPLPTPMPTPPPGAIQPSGGFPVLPPGAVPTPPPGANVVPSRSNLQWQPGDTREPEQRRDLPPSIKLYAPEPIDKETPKLDTEPLLDKKPIAQRGFPAIAQFAEAQKNVYAGLRPSLDGLDWLQANSVQTVVQIRLFGEDDSADRKQVEKRNMRYVAFEVSPDVLTKEKTDEFVKLIRDGAKQGIFVYDEDGALAGAMWYLQQRFGEFLEDEPARLNARQLGLQTDRAGQHREMWLAAHKVAKENNR